MRLSVLAATAVTSLALAPAALADTTTPGTLSVNASGSAMVTPDQASLFIDVHRSAASTGAALSATNRRIDAIVAAAKGLGVDASAIQTNGISTSCGRVKVGTKPHQHFIHRCQADESLSITTTTQRVGAVIDAATRAGASNISGPQFSFSDPSAGVIAAEHAAIANARAQADAAAAQLGDTVTGVQSLVLNPQTNVGPVAGTSGSSAAAAPSTPTTVHPGQQEVDATVAVTFTIAPAS